MFKKIENKIGINDQYNWKISANYLWILVSDPLIALYEFRIHWFTTEISILPNYVPESH